MQVALDYLDYLPESEVYVIPVRIDNCNPSHDVLNELHWVDLFPDWDSGIEKINKSIELLYAKSTEIKTEKESK